MPRPKGSRDLIADRRRRALKLVESGLSLREVARRVECAPSSVMRWARCWRRCGAKALEVRASSGRPPKLALQQRRRLLRLLLQGPLAQGHSTNLWTTGRIAAMIQREFGVRYHRDHVGRLLHSMQWSHQRPEKRALERDEPAIGRWKRQHWPRVKKTPLGWAPISSSPTNRGFS